MSLEDFQKAIQKKDKDKIVVGDIGIMFKQGDTYLTDTLLNDCPEVLLGEPDIINGTPLSTLTREPVKASQEKFDLFINKEQ